MGIECMLSAVTPSEAQRFAADSDIAFSGSRKGMQVSLEKAWHGLHYLLTGSAGDGNPPLGFILNGGEEIGDDTGYGPARLFSVAEVRHLHTALEAMDDDTLWSRFDPAEMSGEGVYPDCWDEEESELREEYVHYFHEMKKLISKANREGHALLVMMT